MRVGLREYSKRRSGGLPTIQITAPGGKNFYKVHVVE